jgi:hypothetical protein
MLRPKDGELETSLGYIEIPFLKKKTNKTKKRQQVTMSLHLEVPLS